MGIIYKFKNLENGKIYIGQSINDDKTRYNNHKSSYKNQNNCEYDSPLHRAFRKYGFEKFNYEIIANYIEDQELLNFLEQYYISCFNSVVPNGYNIETGGKNCSKPKSLEQREKIVWYQAKLSEDEIIELRKAFLNNESPTKIYNEKYKDRFHYNSFLNIWSGRRYRNIMPEVFENKKHTIMDQEKANQIRDIYQTKKISYRKLAKQFNCSPSTIADIIHNRTWKKK